MKAILIPTLVFAVCSTVAQNNVTELQANAKPAQASLKEKPAIQLKKKPHMQIETMRRPLIDREPASERKSSSLNSSAVSVKAFPNPFAGELTVAINDASAAEPLYEATVFDLQGRKVYSQNLMSKREKLNLTVLASGMYVLTVTKNGVVVLQEKLAKE